MIAYESTRLVFTYIDVCIIIMWGIWQFLLLPATKRGVHGRCRFQRVIPPAVKKQFVMQSGLDIISAVHEKGNKVLKALELIAREPVASEDHGGVGLLSARKKEN